MMCVPFWIWYPMCFLSGVAIGHMIKAMFS
jgi:hypothetical protein